MTFVDVAKIFLRAGDGGNGCVSFCRERNRPFGGPDGGNGGRGGDVVFVADKGMAHLLAFRYRQHFKAQRGGDGAGRLRNGAQAPPLQINVPTECVVLAEDRATVLADMTECQGAPVVVCRGGDGGLGNHCFKSSTQQAPRKHTLGGSGEERWVWLQLKLLSDVGLVGLPNVGKSTLLACVTRARPRVGAYPYTTVHPLLGVVDDDSSRFVMADLPGLIKDAHKGVGLGTRFLSHVERCRCLLHLIDAHSAHIEEDYDTILHELASYGHGLMDKKQLVCLSKIDGLDEGVVAKKVDALQRHCGREVMALSSLSGQGVGEVMGALVGMVHVPEERGDVSWQPL
ncbi:MAG: GTPase ObgE [Alphaproteobacteria bacterium GM202ARS2]|nr:GTPase ObgE [Alphaproteobacteria bacterium GM202ARS2]